jgi:hypothetical protein
MVARNILCICRDHKLEERESDERKKVSLDEMKKGVHPYGKRRGRTLLLLEPTPDQASR